MQELLDTPNERSPAQGEALTAFTTNLADYRRTVRKQALKYPPPS
jgi:ubiquitin-conjugating enzyme E2 I